MSSPKIFVLKSYDGEFLEVEEAVLFESLAMKEAIQNLEYTGTIIQLPYFTGKTLAKVIEYSKRHVDDKDLKSFDAAEFIKVENDMLLDLLLAANYLNIKSLIDLTCKAFVDVLNGNTAEEIRKIFNIENELNRLAKANDIQFQITGDFEWLFHNIYY